MTTGQQLRIDGISANLAAATAGHKTYKDLAEAALARLAKSGEKFTADDVRAQIPDTAEVPSPNLIPSLFGTWSKNDRIIPVDWSPAQRSTRHGSRNHVWTGNPYSKSEEAA